MSDASKVSKRMLSIGLAAIMVLSSIVVVLPVQKAYAAVDIQVTNVGGKFFGPSLARVIISDSAKTNDSDSINVNVEARRGTTSLGSTGVVVDAIGTSGQFELYIAAHTDALPANPTQNQPDDDTPNDISGEYSLVRIYSGATDLTNDGNTKAISTTLQSGDVIRITYGGVTKDIKFESTTATLTTDRTTAGDGNRIILRLNDPDANVDPTRVDEIPLPPQVSDLLTATTGTLDLGSAKFVETGQNTGIFELTITVNGASAPRLTGITTFPSNTTLTVKDHDVYAIYDGSVAFNVASITDGAPADGSVTVDFTLTFSADPGTINNSDVTITGYTPASGTGSTSVSVSGTGNTRTLQVTFTASPNASDSDGVIVTVGGIDNPVTLNSVTASASGDGVTLPASPITDNSSTLGKAPYNSRTSTTSTSSQSVSLRNVDGSIDLAAEPTIANGLQIRITDADRNIDTTARDTFSAQVEINNQTLPATLVFKETDDNTGIFVPDLAGNKIEIVPVATSDSLPSGAGVTVIVTGKIVLGTDNKLYVLASAISEDIDLTITYNDPQGDPSGSKDFSIIRKIKHFAGNINTTTTSVPVTGKAVIEINDMDLNVNPNGKDFYTVTFSGNNSATENNSTDFRGLADLHIKARGSGVDFSGATPDLVIGLEETEPNSGIFRGEVDISTINTALGSNPLTDGDRITFEYIDNTESPTITRTIEVRIGKPSGTIELDRTSYPPSTNLSGVGERTTKIHVVITNPSFNTSSTSQDILTLKDGDNNFENGEVRMQLIKGTTTLTIQPGFLATDGSSLAIAPSGLSFPTSASEDGANTGRFTFDIDLPRTIGTNTIDDGWQVRLIYMDSNGDEQTATATIVANTATITTDKPTYDLGSTIILQIREPDWNNDSDKIDEISTNIADLVVDSDKVSSDTLTQIGGISGITLDPSNVLRETDKNTGIFEIKIKNINSNLVSRGKNLEFTYTDRTPSGGGTEIDVKQTVLITSATVDIIFDKEKYTPFDRVLVSIVDPAANQDPDRKESLTGDARVRLTIGGVSRTLTSDFEETEPNSGVFRYKPNANGILITDSSDGNPNAKPGDGIRVEYRSPDKQTEISKSVIITFNDGSISLDKDSYKIGDTAKITIEDPDENRNPDVPDQFSVKVVSDTDPTGISVTVRETGDRTGKFTAEIILTSGLSSGNRLQVGEGDQITAIYTDETLPDAQTITQQLVNRENTTGLRTLQTRDVAATATIGISVAPTERFAVQQPRTVDQAGNPTTPSVNVLVSIATQIKNNTSKAMDYVYIVQVKDANGIVVSISTVSSTLDGGRTANVSASWLPTAAGTYTIETFVWSELGKPSPLSPVQKITVTVT